MKRRETLSPQNQTTVRQILVNSIKRNIKKKKKIFASWKSNSSNNRTNVPKLLRMVHISFTSDAFWRVHILAERILNRLFRPSVCPSVRTYLETRRTLLHGIWQWKTLKGIVEPCQFWIQSDKHNHALYMNTYMHLLHKRPTHTEIHKIPQ